MVIWYDQNTFTYHESKLMVLEMFCVLFNQFTCVRLRKADVVLDGYTLGGIQSRAHLPDWSVKRY